MENVPIHETSVFTGSDDSIATCIVTQLKEEISIEEDTTDSVDISNANDCGILHPKLILNRLKSSAVSSLNDESHFLRNPRQTQHKLTDSTLIHRTNPQKSLAEVEHRAVSCDY